MTLYCVWLIFDVDKLFAEKAVGLIGMGVFGFRTSQEATKQGFCRFSFVLAPAGFFAFVVSSKLPVTYGVGRVTLIVHTTDLLTDKLT